MNTNKSAHHPSPFQLWVQIWKKKLDKKIIIIMRKSKLALTHHLTSITITSTTLEVI